jgi:hypothetical protein
MSNPRVESPAKYRAEDRFLFIVVPLLLSLYIPAWLLHHFNIHPTGFLAVMCALVFTSPILAGIAVFAIYLGEEKDEFQRTILSRAMLWGTGVTLCVTTVWGTLENFGVVPALRANLVIVLFTIPYLIALKILHRRYR